MTATDDADLPSGKNSAAGFKEDPYVFLEADGDQWWPAIKEFYGFRDEFPAGARCFVTVSVLATVVPARASVLHKTLCM